jgi:hypothetical protein
MNVYLMLSTDSSDRGAGGGASFYLGGIVVPDANPMLTPTLWQIHGEEYPDGIVVDGSGNRYMTFSGFIAMFVNYIMNVQ